MEEVTEATRAFDLSASSVNLSRGKWGVCTLEVYFDKNRFSLKSLRVRLSSEDLSSPQALRARVVRSLENL